MADRPRNDRLTLTTVAAALVALGAGFGTGCRSASPAPPPVAKAIPEDRPKDFIFAATIYSPKSMRDASLPRSLKPARYIIEADGVLRAAVGPGSTVETYPGQTRQLTPRQFDSLWRLVRDSGMLDPGNASRVDDPETIQREPGRTTALVYIGYGESRTTLRIVLDRTGEGAVNAEKVIDKLAELAWVTD
jgi:hypothetical protein